MKKMETELKKFHDRLAKIGIDVKMSGNYPWIYLDKVNDCVVEEKFHSDHNFTVAFLPARTDMEFHFTELSEIFKILRKYTNMTKLHQTSKYKDGGSIGLQDKSGKKYWLCRKFGEKNKHRYNKLFVGDINDENPKLAEGEFQLDIVSMYEGTTAVKHSILNVKQ